MKDYETPFAGGWPVGHRTRRRRAGPDGRHRGWHSKRSVTIDGNSSDCSTRARSVKTYSMKKRHVWPLQLRQYATRLLHLAERSRLRQNSNPVLKKLHRYSPPSTLRRFGRPQKITRSASSSKTWLSR